MKVAVMQPYLFPYIGYFQLINSVDCFVFYDDVDYIQRGWINRNRILINKESKYFTVPVKKSRLGTPIHDVYIVDFNSWKMIFLTTLRQSYKKAKNFDFTFKLLQDYLINREFDKIDDFSISSIKFICNILNIKSNFIRSSELNIDKRLEKEEKLEYIIKRVNGKSIILPPGSKELYHQWNPVGISKHTLSMPDLKYYQNMDSFVDNLSIIDILMHNTLDETIELINNFKCG
tara:strand:- start:17749 stop:18444 length:696 start_codon:yes stop_codon:yes gene_type:complete